MLCGGAFSFTFDFMKQAYLLRAKSDGKQVLGAFVAQNLDEVFVAKSLELAWKNNAANASCIPTGEYICKWTRSNRLSAIEKTDVFTYEVFSVPNRGGIRIHSANFFTQISGCIALGSSHKDINMDRQLDVIHSGVTVNKFNELMNKEDFKLIVKNINEFESA